ncbi:AraC family transcriptional regulator [Paenibacillus sp. 1P03SA]|uniref:AraC family transcriptional regulator n=1 Tax=Paenibacillus sp. 1P03SA TaxID=3132294 RepID=UPI00399F084C
MGKKESRNKNGVREVLTAGKKQENRKIRDDQVKLEEQEVQKGNLEAQEAQEVQEAQEAQEAQESQEARTREFQEARESGENREAREAWEARETRETRLNRMQRTHLEQVIEIRSLITMYYFEHGKDYVFRGERHNFWELLYVDKGEIEVVTDDAGHVLKQGMAIFHEPNEFHSFRAAPGRAPNVIVLTFDCDSPAMNAFAGGVLRLKDEERELLARIVEEGENAFEFPFEYPLKRREKALPGSEQLLRCYFEAFLIRLLRRAPFDREVSRAQMSSPARQKNQEELAARVIAYLEANVELPVTLDEISRHFHIGKTVLKETFKAQTGTTVMKYWSRIKMSQAKLLIREETCNFTEIAGRLGFGSVHHFSKTFKKASGMSPSEYARSVKARMGPEDGRV